MKRLILVALLLSLLPKWTVAMAQDVLTESNGLSSNRVWCCFQDSRGYIWIGTDAGLDRYDGSHFKKFSHPTRSLDQSEGIIWAGTDEGLWTYSLESGTFTPFTKTTNYGVNIISRVNDISVTDNKHLWVGTEGQGLFVYNILTGDLTQHSVKFQFVRSVSPENDGRVTVTDQDGNAHLFSAEGKYLRQLSAPNIPAIHSMTDREGNSWIPTDGNGLQMIPKINEGQAFFPFPQEESIISPIPLTEDSDGNIIIGLGNKLFILSPGENHIKNMRVEFPQHGNITRLLNTSDGIWAGTDTDCIWRYDSKKRKIVNYHIGGITNALYKTGQGVLMAGTNLGVFSWDPVKDRLLRELNRTDIRILIDGEKAKESSSLKEFEVVSQSSVIAMCEDATGHYLYLATSNRGFFRKDLITGVWEHLLTGVNDASVLPWNKLTALIRTSRESILAGTNGEGLWSMDDKSLTFKQIHAADPRLNESRIFNITEDGIGSLWICSSSGLWRMNPEGDVFERFSIKAESILYATDGKLYLAGHDGISSILPKSMKPSSKWPPVVIQEMSVADSTFYIPPGGLDITLSYLQNSFSISLAALSFSDPSQNLYSWRLDGIDKDWTHPTNISIASYNDVTPGHYVFQVQGSDDVLRITVRAPWWKTKWAIALYIVLALTALGFLIVYWQSSLARRYSDMMKKQEEEREKSLYKQRIRFFIGLIHEIRTPLTLIRLQHDKDAPGKSDVITRNLDYMQETIDKILTYDKNVSGNIQMLITRLDMRDVVSSVKETFSDSAASEGIVLETILADSPVWVNADEDMLTKILTNLLSNALKYTKDRISITVAEEDENAIVSVSDNGPGVRKDLREKIFGMFFTAPDDKVAEASGIGVGLAYARQLAQAHNGTLNVEDNVGDGATFILRIPLLKEQSAQNALQTDFKDVSANKLTVLVAEDNRELRETLQKDLSALYDVITAPDGRIALSLMEKKAVDVVVSDVMMPVMDGFTLCRTIKGQLAYSHIPVILLTAKVTLDAKSEGLESGADAYVEKPFTIRQLKAQIDNLIRLREAFRKSVSDFGSSDSPIPAGPEADFIRSINDSIEKQLNEESFSIEGLAYDMAMSRTNFFRKFRALTGVTPNEYLKNYRLDRAAKLIRGGARINEAAESVGFTSSSYFAKCFKARFGVLPKDYMGQSQE